MNLFKSLVLLLMGSGVSSYGQEGPPEKYHLGSTASVEEIMLWNTDIKPDGEGLPAGGGTVQHGEYIYINKCLMCHGPEGKYGPYPQLAGRINNDEFNFGNDRKLTRTVGNYWPYATTLFDYIWRAMPQLEPGSLTGEEVYSLTAYILHLNEIIPADGVINARSLPQINMPARDKFYVDD